MFEWVFYLFIVNVLDLLKFSLWIRYRSTILALLANSDDWTGRPVFRAVFRANAASTESQVAAVAGVFFDGWQVRGDFQFVRRTKMSKCTWRQFPYQALLFSDEKKQEIS